MIELCNKFSKHAKLETFVENKVVSTIELTLAKRSRAMEIDGNVAKVKMSKFRPTMDFNKVKLKE